MQWSFQEWVVLNIMERLKTKLDEFITQKLQGLPSLFICIGMQILFSKSFEFGETRNLGIFNGVVKKFRKKMILKLNTIVDGIR